MRIKISSIVSEPLAGVFRDVTNSLERALQPAFEDKLYGADVGQFSTFAVAVDADKTISQRFCEKYDKVGRYKHPITKDWIKYISFALSFDPDKIRSSNERTITEGLCAALLQRLNDPQLKLPKAFEYEIFAADLRIAIEIYMRAK